MYTKGRAIIISGGSRGLGLHLVEQFLNNGNRVATFARSRTDAVSRLVDQAGENFYFAEVDAGNADEVTQFFGDARRKFTRIDCVVNNAAVGQDQLLMHTDLEMIQAIVQTNILGPTILTRLALKHMILEGGGDICNISSICGSRGYPGLSVYAGSKGYLDAMMRSLAREVGAGGINVNCVAPGFFESEMSSVLLPAQLETIKRRTPSGNLATEENIFAVVDLLLSGVANIQGQVILVDGGISS